MDNKGELCIKFIESLRQSQGSQWAGQPLKLLPWQQEIVRAIFGQKNDEGHRLIRHAFIFVPRKNRKDYAYRGDTSIPAGCRWGSGGTNFLLFG